MVCYIFMYEIFFKKIKDRTFVWRISVVCKVNTINKEFRKAFRHERYVRVGKKDIISFIFFSFFV